MKKTLLFVSVLFFSLTVISQSIYNATDYVSSGDSIHLSSTVSGLQSFKFDTTGANINWDYSGLALSSQSDSKWISPSDGGYKNSWCGSNGIIIGCNSQFSQFTDLASQGLDSLVIGTISFKNIVHHYKKGSTNLSYKMFGATIQKGNLPITIPVQYDNADTVISFPIQYAAKDSNNYAYSIDLNSQGINFKNVVRGKRVNHVEGWGSIVTPYKTYSNALKIKTIIYKEDSLYTGQNTTGKKDTLVKYAWYDTSEKIPVLEVEGNLVMGNVIYTKSSYIDTIKCVTPKALFSYAPLVPYYDLNTFSSTVNFGNLSASSDSVYWDFGDGTTTTNVNPTHTFSCPGIQNVKLIAVNKVCNPFRIDTTTIPVYITDSTNYFSKTSTATICEGDSLLINGKYEKTNGVYSKSYASTKGCDSTITVTLTVTTINKNISKLGSNLTSNQVNASYQWLDCSNNYAIIPSETAISFNVSQNGMYAVEITKNACVDTSSCESVIITNIEKVELPLLTSVAPNPTKGLITIKLTSNNVEVKIRTTNGQLVKQWLAQGNTVVYDTSSLQKGLYFIELVDKSTGQAQTVKFIKN